jgi:hypothetical protein
MNKDIINVLSVGLYGSDGTDAISGRAEVNTLLDGCYCCIK